MNQAFVTTATANRPAQGGAGPSLREGMRVTADAAKWPPIDLDDLGRRTFGDPALRAEVLALFLERAPVLAGALGAEDASAACRAAHTLAGAARGIGAIRLGDRAALAEAALVAAADPRPGPAHRDPEAAVAAAVAELDRVCRFIAGHLAETGGSAG